MQKIDLHYTHAIIIPSSLFGITVNTYFFSLCSTRGSNSDRTVTTTLAHYYHNTCARGRSRRGTLSKMASFIAETFEMWDWRRTIAWGQCTPLTIVDQFGIKISGFTPSYKALGRLLKKKKRRRRNNYDDENSDFAYERFLVWRDEGS